MGPVCVENKVAFLLLCCLWSFPSGKLTSQRGERMRRVLGARGAVDELLQVSRWQHS